MPKRTIEYTVSADSISPVSVQNGGVAGDENAVEIVFDLSGFTLDDTNRIRVDITDGSGAFYSSENLAVSGGRVLFNLPREVTLAGGIAQLHLVITTLENGAVSSIFHSYPALVRFEASPDMTEQYHRYEHGLSGLAAQCENYVRAAEESANKAEESANAASESAESFAGLLNEHKSDSNAHKTLFDNVKSSITALHDNVDDNWNQMLIKEVDIRNKIADLQKQITVVDVNGNVDKLLNKTLDSITTSVTEIPEEIFLNCTGLVYFSGENVSKIGKSAFQKCYSLNTVRLGGDTGENGVLHIPSSVESVGEYAFADCKKITKIIVEDGVSLGNGAFADTGVTEITFPGDMTSVPHFILGFTPLKTLDLNENVQGILTRCFQYSDLEKLILRRTERMWLSSDDAFIGTPISKGTGYIYVPDDLVDSYKTATNWSTFASQFRPLSTLE